MKHLIMAILILIQSHLLHASVTLIVKDSRYPYIRITRTTNHVFVFEYRSDSHYAVLGRFPSTELRRARVQHLAMMAPKAILSSWVAAAQLLAGYDSSPEVDPVHSYTAYRLLSDLLGGERLVWYMSEDEFAHHLENLEWILSGMEQVP